MSEDIQDPSHPRVEALQQQYAAVDVAIAEEETRPRPDAFRVTELKRERLRIKDKMARHV